MWPSTNTLERPRVDPLTLLIERAARGDEQALAGLYDATAGPIHGLATRIVGDRQVADEVALDVYLQAWRQAASFDRARGTPLAWLLTITRSRAIDRLRALGARPAGSDGLAEAHALPSDEAGPDETAAEAERRRIVGQALARLSGDERAPIELAYFQGLSHREIATRLAMPLGTVKTRIRLGMMRLRRALAERRGDLL